MASKVIYTCDNCKKEFDKPDEMWAIKLEVASMKPQNFMPNRSAVTTHFYHSYLNPEWCRECVDKLDLLNRLKQNKPKDDPTPIPTLGEKLEAIVSDMVNEALENR